MDLIDRIIEKSAHFQQKLEHLKTEEATKSALIMPFINNILGYNVFDPTEVVPEYDADIGQKKGEKVDYAILSDGKPIILFECKKYGAELKEEATYQLQRYFQVTDAKFGVLTDGITYLFYTDLDKKNLMDNKPFLEFDMLNIDESIVEELKKFTKDSFNLENIISTASNLKYTKEIKRILSDEWINPSDDFIKYFASKVYSGPVTQLRKTQFAPLIKKALHEFLRDRIYDRLQKVQEVEEASQATDTPEQPATADDESADLIVTTEEEMEAYFIVKAILCKNVSIDRLAIRDRISYCNVLLDNNGRKPICRFYFNNPKNKSVVFFGKDKQEERIAIDSTSDLYNYADKLHATVNDYEGAK
jgi:predicted type IV restriction endonuclease